MANIWSFHEDRKGNLWVGTLGGGLDLFNRENSTFSHRSFDPDNPNSRDSLFIRRAVVQDAAQGELPLMYNSVVDMNDRSLRQITSSLGGVSNGYPREDGFDITVASEVMAIFCLATSAADLERQREHVQRPLVIPAPDIDRSVPYSRVPSPGPWLPTTWRGWNPSCTRALLWGP